MVKLKTCPLHGQPVGPPPARNCPACRAAIIRTIDPRCAKCGRHFETVSERRRHQCPG